MSVKTRLISFFEKNRGSYLSGEEIAETLGVTRAAVWKAVKGLQADGYIIDAVTNKGYCLSEESDIISETGIRKYLIPDLAQFNFNILHTVDSTNNYAKILAGNMGTEGNIVISENQTAGKGRLGRSFYSPQSTGLYMSIILNPKIPADRSILITTAAAVSVCEAISSLSGKNAEIKWVNDILIEGKKVCGILTEASFDAESGSLEYAVCGIGINLYSPEGGFPEGINNIAASVFSSKQKDIKNRLAAEILNRFFGYYKNLQDKEFVSKYKKLCYTIGKNVNVILPNSPKKAVALDIDDMCRMLVEYEDGTRELISSGEISIKPEEY